MKHPIQPLEKDKSGTMRFKPNSIVSFLANGRLHELSMMYFPTEDWIQLAQLTGYSLSGFSELSYVDDETYQTAERMAEYRISEDAARIDYLKTTMEEVRNGLKKIVPLVFRIHEDDLQP
jgi:hypothetical protein